jgi:hypothetical protein
LLCLSVYLEVAVLEREELRRYHAEHLGKNALQEARAVDRAADAFLRHLHAAALVGLRRERQTERERERERERA